MSSTTLVSCEVNKALNGAEASGVGAFAGVIFNPDSIWVYFK